MESTDSAYNTQQQSTGIADNPAKAARDNRLHPMPEPACRLQFSMKKKRKWLLIYTQLSTTLPEPEVPEGLAPILLMEYHACKDHPLPEYVRALDLLVRTCVRVSTCVCECVRALDLRACIWRITHTHTHARTHARTHAHTLSHRHART